jgi:1,4-dihydroxy-6-naphthoate synthase
MNLLFLRQIFQNMKLTLGFSSCPNDTYIFDAMIHGKVDTEDLTFDVVMTDVEDLNKRAFNREIDITKLSSHSFLYLTDKYRLLNSGSALGRKNGPLVISKNQLETESLKYARIAIPGVFTTANLLFSIFFPEAINKAEYLFSEIEDAVLKGDADAGVIIHENRFTYEDRGLKKVADLGEIWEMKTGMVVPLGVIAVNNVLPVPVQHKIDRVLRRSVEFAVRNPDSSLSFVKQYAGIHDETIIRKHIDLYVNDFTVDLGIEGRKAIRTLYEEAGKMKIVSKIVNNYFLE